MDDLASVLAFGRAMIERGAQRTIAIPGGVVVLHDTLANKYVLNAVMLDAPVPADLDAAAVSELADSHLGHRAHRYVVVDDEQAGERLAPELERRGWSTQRVQFMVYRRAPAEPGPPNAPAARRIGDAELRAVQTAMAIEERGGDGAVERSLTEMLVGGEAAVRAGTPWIAFGAGFDGELSASCELFLQRPEGEGGIAIIDEVGTLAAARGRGLARAVVGAAIRAALASGCEPVVIPADAEDWPRHLYTRMGFEPIGTQLAFTLADPSPRPRTADTRPALG